MFNKVLLSFPRPTNIFLEFPAVISAEASKPDHLWSDHSGVKYEMNVQNVKQQKPMIIIRDYQSLNSVCITDV